MKRASRHLIFLMVMLFGFSANKVHGQTEPLKLFLDCQTTCYEDYLKQNMQGVEFVRDRHDADVYIMINSKPNGSGGDTYYIHLEGQGKYEGITDDVVFNTNPDTQEEEIRKKLLKSIILGLSKFWIFAGHDDYIQVQFKPPSQQGQKPAVEDKWNNWVFDVGVSLMGNGDSNYSVFNYFGRLSARQIKEMTKFKFSINYSNRQSQYVFGDQTIKAYSESFSSHISEIFGINDHWSYGVFGGAYRSIYSNYKFRGYVSAGVEYNFFPYSQSSKHLLVLQFKLSPQRNIYFEPTIFGKTRETLLQSRMSVAADIIRKWGSINGVISYNQFLWHPDFRSVTFYTGLKFRLVRGLNFRVSARYSITHDQINIAAGGATLEETLLRQKELLSSYQFFASVGLNYSFGSIYNTIVNPRFEEYGHVYYFF